MTTLNLTEVRKAQQIVREIAAVEARFRVGLPLNPTSALAGLSGTYYVIRDTDGTPRLSVMVGDQAVQIDVEDDQPTTRTEPLGGIFR